MWEDCNKTDYLAIFPGKKNQQGQTYFDFYMYETPERGPFFQ